MEQKDFKAALSTKSQQGNNRESKNEIHLPSAISIKLQPSSQPQANSLDHQISLASRLSSSCRIAEETYKEVEKLSGKNQALVQATDAETNNASEVVRGEPVAVSRTAVSWGAVTRATAQQPATTIKLIAT